MKQITPEQLELYKRLHGKFNEVLGEWKVFDGGTAAVLKCLVEQFEV